MNDAFFDRIRQPEYTGENRCGACTVVNCCIAAVLGLLFARRSRRSGAAVFALSMATIYLRGYLVPGTPQLTKRYLPPEILVLFDKDQTGPDLHQGLGTVESEATTNTTADESGSNEVAPGGGQSSETDGSGTSATGVEATDSEITPEEYFLAFEVVEPCADVDDLCLTDSFEEAWFDEIDSIDVESVRAKDIVRAFGIDDASTTDADQDPPEDDEARHEFEIRRFDDARQLRRDDGRVVGKWPSQAALVADITAAYALADRDPRWDSYPPETKGHLLNSLRLFLETCPTSGGSVSMNEETAQSCCQSYDVIAVECDDTGERLFEHHVDEIDA